MSPLLTTRRISSEQAGSNTLMIVLHGLGDSLEGYLWLPEALGLPALNYLLVNAPDPYGDGYSWYDFERDPTPGVDRSRELLCQLIAKEVSEGFPVHRMFLFGFSQGCLMSIEVGVRYPEIFAGIIGISGYVHDVDRLLTARSPVAGDQRFLVTHGTQDPLLPIDQVRSQFLRLAQAGLTLDWVEYPKAHTIAGRVEINRIRAFVEERLRMAPE